MKKQAFLCTVILTGILSAQTPDTLTLDFCLQKARENYPLSRQSELLESASELKMHNLTSNWYPQFSFTGQTSYQSDVTSIDIPIPNVTIPEIEKDAYKLTLDISNTLYDGGATRKQKRLEQATLNVDRQNIEVSLYQLKERVNQVYMTALLLQENEKLLRLVCDEVKSRLASVESGVRNGVLLPMNADALRAEIAKLEQQVLELSLGRESAFAVLSEYINLPLSATTPIAIPEIEVQTTVSPEARPEIRLFDLQKEKIDISKSLLTVRRMPKLSAFAQVGYGRPGLNMLLNEFDDFWVVGMRLSWSPWNWNQTKNDQRWFDIQKNIVLSQKETLEKNLRILLQNDRMEIKKYEALIAKDDEIIALRTNVKRSAASQLENGVITATDYLAELNAETQAKLNQQLHRIRLASAKINYQYDSGKME
ncbi:MAG: TolC family protein [Candidatus Marinimicrobia bacterium]|nr:TolC family protein [Candidatus Neomarinimicrobiota bacterium]